jgi:hypothetical protein
MLSIDRCAIQIRDKSDAIKLLIHESVHHFGIDSEEFADQVAIAVGSIPASQVQVPETEVSPAPPDSGDDNISMSIDCDEIAKRVESEELAGTTEYVNENSTGYCHYPDFSFEFAPESSLGPKQDMFVSLDGGPWIDHHDVGYYQSVGLIDINQINTNQYQVIASPEPFYTQAAYQDQCPKMRVLVVLFKCVTQRN